MKIVNKIIVSNILILILLSCDANSTTSGASVIKSIKKENKSNTPNGCIYRYPNASNGVIGDFNEETGYYHVYGLCPQCGYRDRSTGYGGHCGRTSGSDDFSKNCFKCDKDYTITTSWGNASCK